MVGWYYHVKVKFYPFIIYETCQLKFIDYRWVIKVCLPWGWSFSTSVTETDHQLEVCEECFMGSVSIVMARKENS